jgi:hypothetical protein
MSIGRGRRIAQCAACIAVAIGGSYRTLWADCLDGQLQVLSGGGNLSATIPSFCGEADSFTGNGGVSAECAPCDKFGCFCPDGPCVEASASFSAAGDGLSFDIVLRVNRWPFEDFLPSRSAFATVFADIEIAGGDMLCTAVGAKEDVVEGQKTTTPQNFIAILSPGKRNLSFSCFAQSIDHTDAVVAHCFFALSCVPTVSSQTRSWTNASGGSYLDPANWTTNCAPAHDPPLRSDTAAFGLPTATFIPVTGFGATAGSWSISNTMIDFQGSAELFATNLFAPPALNLVNSTLRLSNGGSLVAPRSGIGTSGAADSVLEVTGSVGPGLSNTGSLLVGRGLLEARSAGQIGTERLVVGSGTGSGTAAARIKGGGSRLHVLNGGSIGSGRPATLEVLDGGLFEASQANFDPIIIGETSEGTLMVRGNDPPGGVSNPATLRADHTLIVGQGAKGTLNIEGGGSVEANSLQIPAAGAAGSGEVTVDGALGPADLTVPGTLFVRATESLELEVKNGGILSTKELVIGSTPVRPGAADVTIRGFGGGPSALFVDDNSACCGEPALVGILAPGQLRVLDGALAQFNGGGFVVGSGAQGLMLVSGQNALPGASTEVISSGEVKIGDASEGVLELTHGAKLSNAGDFKVGLGAANGRVTIDLGSVVDISGLLSVGSTGQGLVEIDAGSRLECDTLVAGGATSQFSGNIIQTDFSFFKINGNAQVGTAGGFASIVLAEDTAVLAIDGTLTIGPGQGVVRLVDARIEGTGNIVVTGDGELTGTGTVAINHTALDGGFISPGLSPGTLTIDGDLDASIDGTLVIEYTGLEDGEFDVLHVTGTVTLGGRLEVHFRNGFAPADPQAFIQSDDFIQADGAVLGDYDERIYAFPDLFADFDSDGDKDLLDVSEFQNCFGRSGQQLVPDCARADWEDNGLLNGVDTRELTARLTGP